MLPLSRIRLVAPLLPGIAAAWMLPVAATTCLAQAQPAAVPPSDPQPAAGDPPSRFGPTRSVPGTKTYFIDVKDGQSVPSKFTVHFGLKGMGIAPAGTDRPNTGHHHLIIDTELPALNEPIPNDFNHLHFGAGQTEADVELPPGDHTLQLLLGDKDHVSLNPPVASNRIVVHVGEGEDAAADADAAGPYKRKASPPNAHEYIEFPNDNAVVPSTFTVKFGLTGMGIAPAGVNKAFTGHHHLLVDAPMPPADQTIPNDFNHYHFGLGQTEAQITLPPGPHTLQLLMSDANHVPHDPPVFSKLIHVTVGRPPSRVSGKKSHHRRLADR